MSWKSRHGWRLSVKVGDLARFIHDGQLVFVTETPRDDLIHGHFITGERNGESVTSYISLMEKVDESR